MISFPLELVPPFPLPLTCSEYRLSVSLFSLSSSFTLSLSLAMISNLDAISLSERAWPAKERKETKKEEEQGV